MSGIEIHLMTKRYKYLTRYKTWFLYQAVYYLEQGFSPMEACQKSVDLCLNETDGRGGVILIDKKGEVGFAFTSGAMAWAVASDKGLRHGLRHGEDITDELWFGFYIEN